MFRECVGLYPIQGSCTGIQGHRRANGSRASALYDVINTENNSYSSFMILTTPATVGSWITLLKRSHLFYWEKNYLENNFMGLGFI